MNRQRPVIGITGPDKGGLAAWIFTALAVRIQGGRPMRITPNRPANINVIDALIIGGGADIDPQHYDAEKISIDDIKQKHERLPLRLLMWLAYPLIYLIRRVLSTKTATHVDKRRDDLEFALLEAALNRQIPVLGICRGAQLINIAAGGTLFQQLGEFYEELPQPRSVFPVKEIIIDADSRLARALGMRSCRVNALHRQAIRTAGGQLRVTARESNSVIQAIEHESLPFVIGVQWHPEYLQLHSAQRRLFGALIGTIRTPVTGNS